MIKHYKGQPATNKENVLLETKERLSKGWRKHHSPSHKGVCLHNICLIAVSWLNGCSLAFPQKTLNFSWSIIQVRADGT